MVAAPVDPNIDPVTAAFWNTLRTNYFSSKHMSAAWLGILQMNSATQPEWVLYKKTFGRAPCMVCLNSSVMFAQQKTTQFPGGYLSPYGVPVYTTPSPSIIPFLIGIGSKGGAVQVVGGPGYSLASPFLYAAGSTYTGSATTVAALNTLTQIATTATANWSSATRTITDGIISGGNTLTSATANFLTGDIGKVVTGAGIPAGTTITGVNGLNLGGNEASLSNPCTNGSALTVTISGGQGVILASDGLHPFTYTGLTTNTRLNGVIISSPAASNQNGNVTMSSSATVANGAQINPASLQTGQGGVSPGPGRVNATTYTAQAWPLHWSSSAYTTLSAALTSGGGISGATSSGWADAQAVNANGNLNAQLDQFVAFAQAIYPCPILLRPLAESNIGGATCFWYDTSIIGWGAQLFRYCVAYMIGDSTGAVGFAGQPVSPTPVHNILYGTNMLAGGTSSLGLDYPTSARVPWTTGATAGLPDFYSVDYYNTIWSTAQPKGFFSSVLTAIPAYSNAVPLLFEAYTNGAPTYQPSSGITVFGGTNGTTGDLHSIGTTFATGSNYNNSTRLFGTSGGTLRIATSNGVMSLTYTGAPVISGPASPSRIATFTVTAASVAAVPAGSIIDTNPYTNVFVGGMCVGDPPTTSPPATPAQFLTGVQNAIASTTFGCHFTVNPLLYGGTFEINSVLFQPNSNVLFQDPSVVNLPNPGNLSIFAAGCGVGYDDTFSRPAAGVLN